MNNAKTGPHPCRQDHHPSRTLAREIAWIEGLISSPHWDYLTASHQQRWLHQLKILKCQATEE